MQVLSFSIDSIMEHDQKTSIQPINSSLSEFGVEYEKNFVVLNDGKHIIGIHPSDGMKLIFESVEKRKAVMFGRSDSIMKKFISTLVYEKDTESLYIGNNDGQLSQYKVFFKNQTFQLVKDYGNLGIDDITSSYQFRHFVFFGGYNNKIRVLDMSTGRLLPGFLKTSIQWIRSLQVCEKNTEQIYLAVSGSKSDYSENKTDLFDLTGLLRKDLVISANLNSKDIENLNKILIEHRRIIKSQEMTIQKLTKKFKKYMDKYNDLKKENDKLQKINKEITKAFKKQKTQSDNKIKQFLRKINILYHEKSKKTIIGKKMSLFGNDSFGETDPFFILKNLRKNLEEEKYKNKKFELSFFDIITQKKLFQQESEAKNDQIVALQNQLTMIRETIGER